MSFVIERLGSLASGQSVSIITPVLNRAETIEHVLTSVAAQSYRPIEHIIVDGGSTDGTVEIVESFSRSSQVPVRWISEPDRGMYDAINKGLRMARGDVLAYLNSDDLYFPWSVEAAVRALQEGWDFVYGDVAIITRRAEGTTFRIQFYRRFDTDYYVHHGILAQATVFWSKKAMEEIGPFDPNLRYLGDVEFWARAGVAGLKFRHLDEVLALVVEHQGTLSALYAEDIQEELAYIRQSVSDRIQPPSRERITKRVEALMWRWRQRVFRRQARSRHPRRWPRFIALLRELDVEIGGNGTAVLLLPARILGRWPRLRRWLDSPDEFERRFRASIRAELDAARRSGSRG